jgi:bisphosphoglycerate-dependent phosphoglycerate mutase
MYGALTGKSKQMVANEYGEAQLKVSVRLLIAIFDVIIMAGCSLLTFHPSLNTTKKWRRGFKIQPPPVSSYSLSYPGNDYKRTKYVKDLRISLMETINRSIEAKKFQVSSFNVCTHSSSERISDHLSISALNQSPKFQVHRKFPKTESLWDCMQRSIPFYTERIVPEAVNKGKRVLITSHENAIRGILMHLCEIPEEAMNQLHLPNGLPLVSSGGYAHIMAFTCSLGPACNLKTLHLSTSILI